MRVQVVHNNNKLYLHDYNKYSIVKSNMGTLAKDRLT